MFLSSSSLVRVYVVFLIQVDRQESRISRGLKKMYTIRETSDLASLVWLYSCYNTIICWNINTSKHLHASPGIISPRQTSIYVMYFTAHDITPGGAHLSLHLMAIESERIVRCNQAEIYFLTNLRPRLCLGFIVNYKCNILTNVL